MDSAISWKLISPPHPTSTWIPRADRLPYKFRPLHRYAPSPPFQTVLITTAKQSEGKSDDDGRAGGEPTSSSSISNLTIEELEQKLGKRRRSRSQEKNPPSVPKPPPKDWDSMTLAEKVWELYVGEKGALYWLNKLAYAAIFILVGGWIAFRFIGPALNLYQLESPLLPPDQILGGSQ